MIKDLFSFLGVVATEEEGERDDGEEKKKKKKITNEPRFVTTHYSRLFRFEATPLSGDLFWFFQQNAKKQKTKQKCTSAGLEWPPTAKQKTVAQARRETWLDVFVIFQAPNRQRKEEKPISFVLLFSQSLCLM